MAMPIWLAIMVMTSLKRSWKYPFFLWKQNSVGDYIYQALRPHLMAYFISFWRQSWGKRFDEQGSRFWGNILVSQRMKRNIISSPMNKKGLAWACFLTKYCIRINHWLLTAILCRGFVMTSTMPPEQHLVSLFAKPNAVWSSRLAAEMHYSIRIKREDPTEFCFHRTNNVLALSCTTLEQNLALPFLV